jgi:hypothetical protein
MPADSGTSFQLVRTSWKLVPLVLAVSYFLAPALDAPFHASENIRAVERAQEMQVNIDDATLGNS